MDMRINPESYDYSMQDIITQSKIMQEAVDKYKRGLITEEDFHKTISNSIVMLEVDLGVMQGEIY
jgi:hypothetical protein